MIKYIANLARAIFTPEAIAGDIRNASIAAIVGSAVALAWNLFDKPNEVSVIVDVNEKGVGFPKGLFDAADAEGLITLEFIPINLRNISVCDFYQQYGRSIAELTMKYLEKYSMCFWVTRQIDNENIKLTIRENTRSGSIQKNNSGSFTCKCN
jgi:hypothetical protein